MPTNDPNDASRYLWFFNSLVRIHVSSADGVDGLSVVEHRVPTRDSPPMHIHTTEDEVFHLLEGEFTFHLGGQEMGRKAGDVVFVPRGVPHTYIVLSAGGARFTTTTPHSDFELYIRALSRPAERMELPPIGEPTPEMMAAVEVAARAHNLQIVGPPLG